MTRRRPFVRLALSAAALFLLLGASGSKHLQSAPAAGRNFDQSTLGSGSGADPIVPSFPLKRAGSGRYLVDQNNVPFLVAGDSPQALFVNLSLRQAASFMRSRKAAGFNTLWINLVCDRYTGGRANGSTWDGIRPFKTVGDLSRPNPAYFARIDAMLGLAARDGFLVFLDPIETGGWLPTLLKNGVARDRAYGEYVGRRYRRFSNITWLNGNDHQVLAKSGRRRRRTGRGARHQVGRSVASPDR